MMKYKRQLGDLKIMDNTSGLAIVIVFEASPWLGMGYIHNIFRIWFLGLNRHDTETVSKISMCA